MVRGDPNNQVKSKPNLILEKQWAVNVCGFFYKRERDREYECIEIEYEIL